MIPSILLRLIAVILTAMSANFMIWIAEQLFRLHLGGRPLPHLTQAVITGKFVFVLIAVAWLIWAVILARRKRTPEQLDLFAAASLCAVALIISTTAVSIAITFVALFPVGN